jgi:signal transduction histidine kinase
MVWFIIILLSAAAGVSITLLILTRMEIKNITDNLKQINSIKTNSKLTLSVPVRRIANLAKEINILIDRKQQTEAQYKKMDMELRQAIANISHDLRTPLTSIIGYVQLMNDESLSPEERQGYGDTVLKRAKSLNMLISSFFDLSRLEANEYSFELQPLNLSGILCELAASFYNDFTSKGIEPAISIDETVPQIIADDTAVRRIYINLIQNALKYSTGFIAISLKMEGNL